jgi:DNA polymerase-1
LTLAKKNNNYPQGSVLLIDGYNIFARNYLVNPSLSNNGEPIGGAIGFLRSLGVLADKFSAERIIVAWEGGKSARRRALHPGYKAGRKPLRLNRSELYEKDLDSPENFMWQVGLAVELLQMTPIEQLYADDCEADDVIGWLCRHRLKNETKPIVICSSDQDMLQLLRDNVYMYSHTGSKLYTKESVKEKYGITPENFVTARAFIGDSSDRIDGVKGVGFKTLVKEFPELAEEEYCSIDDILTEANVRVESQKKPKKILKAIAENPDVPRLNWKLMYLDISNLSAEHVRQLDHRYNNTVTARNRMKLQMEIAKRGILDPQHINVTTFWRRISNITQ